MKKILVPCDFSAQAVDAFRFALDAVAQSKGEIHLVNVIEIPVVHDSLLMPVHAYEETLFKELKEKTEKQFIKLKSKYAGDTKKIKTTVLFGPTSSMVLDYIEDEKIDLVIMGTKGASGVKEIFIGSNAEKIVRKATCPVLAIKKYSKDPIKNIVFPNTLHQDQEELIMRVKALQNFFKATLHIVWINTPSNFTRDNITHKRLKDFAKRFMLKDFTLNIFNDPYEETGVINFTHMIGADMIAMGTHSRKGLAHALNGSVAEDIVNHMDCPIWTSTMKLDKKK
jgi:nucleotide-binding universal stress UspA family protein